MVLRVRQKEDHLQGSVYDSKSSEPDKPIWEDNFQDIEDAQETVLSVAQNHLADNGPKPVLEWIKYSN
jgi:hypothetical protein